MFVVDVGEMLEVSPAGQFVLQQEQCGAACLQECYNSESLERSFNQSFSTVECNN